MENSMEFPQKIKIELPYNQQLYPEEMKTEFWRFMHSYVYYSIVHNSQDMETTQRPINKWIDKKDVV